MKKLLLLFLFCIGITSVNAQKDKQYPYNEIFMGIGTTHGFTDLGGSMTTKKSFLNIRDIDIGQSRISSSFGFRRVFNSNWSISGQIVPLWIAGHDKFSRNSGRNWNFNSFGGEILSIQAEYYPLNWMYVFCGIGELYNHTIMYTPDKKISNNFNTVLLTGVGAGWRMNKLNVHSIEIGLRYSTTDNIDGIKITNSNNDWYYIIQYKLVHRLTFGSKYNENGFLIR